jgi:branched-chain amino acid transport system substrate-binding protein
MISRRRFSKIAAGAGVAIAAPAVSRSSRAQGQPIKIGTSISLTGPLAATKNALIGYQLWRDDINAAGGLLGRPVELVTYDDQSSPAQIPSIFSKLVDIDRVDVLLSPYGAVLSAPVMPFVKQRDLFLMGMFTLASNETVRHDKFFNACPWGPSSQVDWVHGFFDLAKAAGCTKVAIMAADLEFSKTSAAGGKATAEGLGMSVVYDQSYPPNQTDFSAILRNIRAAQPDAVFVCSYPPDSTALVRGLSEIGIGDSVKIFGGSMVGPQYAALLAALGPALNGIVNFHLYVPEPTMRNAAIDGFLARYEPLARQQNVDPLGHYIPPFCYAAGQIVEAAVKGARSLNHAEMARWLHANPVDTIVGRAAFNNIGDWTERRVLMVQFRGIVGRDVEQFRQPGKQVILDPPALKTGELAQPFSAARSR